MDDFVYPEGHAPGDFMRVTDECAARIGAMLRARFAELEAWRHAINDHYAGPDIVMDQTAVDDEEELILRLLVHLGLTAALLRDDKRDLDFGESDPWGWTGLYPDGQREAVRGLYARLSGELRSGG